MNSSADSLTCAHCRGGFPAGQRVVGAFVMPGEPAPADDVYCSRRCLDRAVSAYLTMPVCQGCGTRFPPSASDRAGRPASYCSPECRKSHERVLGRAMRQLARDSFPSENRLGDVEQALDDAEALTRAWDPDLGPPPLQPPSPRARAELAGRVSRLEELRDRARLLLGRAAEEEALAKLAAADRAAVAEAEGAGADWRRELLAGGPPGD